MYQLFPILVEMLAGFKYDTRMYGRDFATYPHYRLFNNYQMIYFAGILDLDNGVNLEACPIFIHDCETDEDPTLVGNFRKYMAEIWRCYLTCPDAKHRAQAKKAVQELSAFPAATLKHKKLTFKLLTK